MKVLNSPKQNIKIIECRLSKIVLHHEFKKYDSLMAIENFAISAANCLTQTALELLYYQHPILCCRIAGGKYQCVSGLNTLQIARVKLGHDGVCAIVMLPKLTEEEKIALVQTSVFLDFSLHAITNRKSIGIAYSNMDQSTIDLMLTDKASNKKKFVAQCAYSHNTIF